MHVDDESHQRPSEYSTGHAVDVRDMLCAQALAVVNRAMRTTATGSVLEIRCNARDVAKDLLAWARAARHVIIDDSSTDEDRRISMRKA